MNKAEEMLQLATLAQFKQKQDEFPQELYDIIYERIESAARSGKTTTRIDLNYKPYIREEVEYLNNVKSDFVAVRKKLMNQGFKVDTNLYDMFTMVPPYISVTW